ncbi:MAG: flavin reductase [Defluviitaleaceae bacterium]|nr:flavin reductase [Defluviitaleaceae bacterium]
MKKEFSTKPEKINEQWPGELTEHGSWHDELIQLPSPLFLVTSYKSNGKENACFQSRSTFLGNRGEFFCILGWVPTHGHLYQTLKETKCCVLNFPTHDLIDKCFKTIEVNQFETDEITAAGLTSEPSLIINAPRIKECFLNVECEYLWEQELNPGDPSTVVIGLKAVNVCMDSDYYDQNKIGRYGKTGYVYSANSPRNPDTGEIGKNGYAAIEIYQ